VEEGTRRQPMAPTGPLPWPCWGHCLASALALQCCSALQIRGCSLLRTAEHPGPILGSRI